MNIYLTLDYELFFGTNSGGLMDCIIKPTEKLIEILISYNIKAVFFVDAGYLVKLKELKNQYPAIQNDFEQINLQIKELVKAGHSIELHIHPHWEDATYQDDKWIFDASRYKLTDFSEKNIQDIVTKYKKVLEEVSGTQVTTFRAGGWSMQPFEKIGKVLSKNNIFIDSTVFPKGYYQSKHQQFDFRNASTSKTQWKFNNNPTSENKAGKFIEFPISSIRVSPFFFYKLAVTKLLKQKKHKAFGNGTALKIKKTQLINLLTKPSYTVVSIDGYKSKLLNKALKKYSMLDEETTNFVIIGHPKALTPFSLKKLSKFIKQNFKKHNFTTFRDEFDR